MDFENDPAELLSLSEAANLMRVSPMVLLAEIRDGRLAAHRVRSRWMMTRQQIAAWLKRCEKPAAES
jgi:excisionase family DNA binding protein